MAIVAVAGGTSPTLGRSIVSAILASGKNTPVILSRKKDDGQTDDIVYGAKVRQVDYASHESMVKALLGVETVISVIKISGPGWSTCQINLLHAAKAAGVRRFAPAEYEAGPLAAGSVDITASKIEVWKACGASGLECTRFCCGMFMNYLALGSVREDMTHGLVDKPLIWDTANRTAELPVKDDGSLPKVSITDIADIGKFVAAACELPPRRWEPTLSMYGENIRLDQVLKLLEEKLSTTFVTTAVDAKELQERVQSVEGTGKNMDAVVLKLVSQIELMMLKDKEDMRYLSGTLNKLCPQVRPISVAEFISKVFSRVPWPVSLYVETSSPTKMQYIQSISHHSIPSSDSYFANPRY